MEKTYEGKVLEELKEQAYQDFKVKGADPDDIDFEILEQPVKKLFGVKGQYKITASWDQEAAKARAADAAERIAAIALEDEEEGYTSGPLSAVESAEEPETDMLGCEKVKRATAYLTNLLDHLGVTGYQIHPEQKKETVVLNITGENLGVIIGRRGETLDALQYLTILASSRGEESKCRVSVDCCGYRGKRREALTALAEKTAHKVLKTGRRIILEPMNPYERRIIHSKVAEIDGVNSHSTGEEPFRKVVISSNQRQGGDKYRDNRRRQPMYNGRNYKQSGGYSTSFEREYKDYKDQKRTSTQPVEYSEETMDTEKNTALYGKIEL